MKGEEAGPLLPLSEEDQARKSQELMRELRLTIFKNSFKMNTSEHPLLFLVVFPIEIFVFAVVFPFFTLDMLKDPYFEGVLFGTTLLYVFWAFPTLFPVLGFKLFWFGGLSQSRAPHLLLTPLSPRGVFRENLIYWLRSLVVYAACIFLVLQLVVWSGRLGYPGLFLYLLLWLGGVFLFASASVLSGLGELARELEGKATLLKQVSGLLLFSLPLLAVFEFPLTLPLLLLALLLPLELKAWQLWQKHILPNCENPLFWHNGMITEPEWATRRQDPLAQLPAEPGQAGAEQGAGTGLDGREETVPQNPEGQDERTIWLGDKTRGWDAVEELVRMNHQTGGQEVAKACLPLASFFFFFGLVNWLLFALLGEENTLGAKFAMAIPGALALMLVILYTLIFFIDLPDSHPGIREALEISLQTNQKPENSDWFALLPYPGHRVCRSSLGFIARGTMKASVPWLFFVVFLLVTSDLSGTFWAFVFTLGLLGTFASPFVVSVLRKYGLSSSKKVRA